MEHVIIAQLRAAEDGARLLRALVEGLDQGQTENRLAALTAAQVVATIAASCALLEAWGNGPAAEAPPREIEPDDGVCRHRPEQRKSIATHGRPDAWMCQVCGFINEGET